MPPHYTLAEGCPYPDASTSVQLRDGRGGGLSLLQDTQLIENLAHFSRERIPERVVHAKAAGARGVFKVTNDNSDITCADFLNGVGKKTECLVRISTVGGESGSSDTLRDIHGFSIKFFTEQGNQDFVFNNTPVFFIRDPQKFPSLNRSHKRHPSSHLPDATMFWDFHTGSPESIHQLMVLFSDRGTPASLRQMHAYSGHTYKLTKEDGSFKYVKFHFRSKQGVKSFNREESEKINGSNPDFLIQDMYEAIERGEYPSWDLCVQIMDPKDAESYKWNIFDMTKVWPHSDYPMRKLGQLTLNQNPRNYFADIEQAAFSPSTMVPGIAPSADPMLQARMFAYPDAQRYRLGVNYQQLPTNRARTNVYCPFERDGAMTFYNYDGDTNYVGSSVSPAVFASSSSGRGKVASTITEHEKWVGEVVSHISPVEEQDYEQARALWNVLGREDGHQDRLIGNVADKVRLVKEGVLRKRVYGMFVLHEMLSMADLIEMFGRVDAKLGKRLEEVTEKQVV
ncbi:catalase easC [Aspergillus thermomutatus]|uniref:Catalase core domain-containing protein n=1 Tax=Aspergillus thermomutatus TaxID=41047 RepID=A0A397H350_ASPTH|nr:uncharacterized protein CDV56_107726 [Aspergillus thermomutatus]RHZ56288.1 hypothetical protein CDV56_107726 [Aspergillus thermomutatus]